jgi:DNA invertase Pin-like site-specific DNA recombinase
MKIQKTFPKQLGIGVAYIHSSADAQDAANIIDTQLRQIEVRAEQDGVELVEVYIDEEIASKARPSLATLLVDAKSGKFEVLYCHRLDHFSRELPYATEVAGQLNNNGIVIRTIEEKLDTESAEGRLMLHMLITLGKHWSSFSAYGE